MTSTRYLPQAQMHTGPLNTMQVYGIANDSHLYTENRADLHLPHGSDEGAKYEHSIFTDRPGNVFATCKIIVSRMYDPMPEQVGTLTLFAHKPGSLRNLAILLSRVADELETAIAADAVAPERSPETNV